MKQEIGQNQLFEEKEISILMPFNLPIKRIFNDELFEIKTAERNGEKPLIIIKYKPKCI